jgi:hypothetical protein
MNPCAYCTKPTDTGDWCSPECHRSWQTARCDTRPAPELREIRAAVEIRTLHGVTVVW